MRWSRATAIDLGWAIAATVWLILALAYWRPISAWWVAIGVAVAGGMWAAFWVRSPGGRRRYTQLLGTSALVWFTAWSLHEGSVWAVAYGFFLLITLQDTVREFRRPRRP